MLFGKSLFTVFTLAAMAITHVASAPTAQPETSIVEKRDTIADKMTTCYNQVQTHCGNIEQQISNHGGVIDVDVAVDVGVELTAVVDLLVALCADISADIKLGVDVNVLSSCGSTFILLVNLCVSILIKIAAACQGGALAILAVIVVRLKVQVTLCASILIGCIDGLLGLIIGLVLQLLANLKIDINACISVFVDACGKFGV
jgi:hypothetical protein